MRSALASLAVLASVASIAAVLASNAPARADDSVLPPQVVRPIPRPPVAVVPRVEIVDDGTQPLPTFMQGGRRFLLGETGERYRIRIVNPTATRFEAVVSVDGLDAIDGRTASLDKRGYVIPAFGDVTIDGWRTSLDQVAAFCFSSVRASYAARTGHDRNVGVIGVAFFRERASVVWRPSPWSRRAGETPSAAPTPAPSGEGPGDDAPKAGGARAPSAAARPGLGTQFGEAHESRVELTSFVRADARRPSMVELRYDDRAGLLARGIRLPPRDDREAENALRDTAQPFPGGPFAQPPR